MEGRSVEVLVVKIVRSGQSLLNWEKIFFLSSGSSGTDSLTMSASRAASSGLVVMLMRATAASASSCVIFLKATKPARNLGMVLRDFCSTSSLMSYITTL